MDIKKASAEGQISEESMGPSSPKTTHLNKDMDSKEGQGLKPAGICNPDYLQLLECYSCYPILYPIVEHDRFSPSSDSNLIKVPERSCEDKWLKKNVLSSPLNSPSPAVPPTFQAASDSNQPLWMELAKRKSMAWNDKSMD